MKGHSACGWNDLGFHSDSAFAIYVLELKLPPSRTLIVFVCKNVE